MEKHCRKATTFPPRPGRDPHQEVDDIVRALPVTTRPARPKVRAMAATQVRIAGAGIRNTRPPCASGPGHQGRDAQGFSFLDSFMTPPGRIFPYLVDDNPGE
jgi:hypothetical protein